MVLPGSTQADVELARRCSANVLITGGDARIRRSIAERIHQGSRLHDVPLTVVTSVEHWNAVLRHPSAAIFIEEIGQLSTNQQADLLQALERNSAFPEPRWRVISASSSDLYQEVIEGRFHDSLYYRLNLIHIALP
jgi:transcriptional regulator of acetoin/glycerol metabolism